MSEVKTITLHNGRKLEMSLDINDVVYEVSEDKYGKDLFLGTLNDIKEEQIVDNDLVEVNTKDTYGDDFYNYYRDYTKSLTDESGWPWFDECKQGAKKSLLSLLQVNNIDISKEWVLILKK